ncbi:MAG TPA: translation elongation factor Ts, partial [Pseudobdellovibrionaceae bacterium]|nr:translation elongation factor Ts [Pseudobdellovibrionaceae bacterium]
AEGMVFAKVENNVGVVVEVNSETDFVARNEHFKNFVTSIGAQVLKTKPAGDLLKDSYYANPSQKVEDYLKETIAKIGENIVCRRFERYEVSPTSMVHSYVHGEGKIGVLLEITVGSESLSKNENVRTAAQDICLHIAAMSPMAVSSNEIPAEVVSKEKEILKAKNIEQGKKPEMVDKIVEGQIRKFLAENCLLDQAFVKNPDLKISDYLAGVAKAVGGSLSIKRFVRFELGQGIEKQTVDFAAEVAAQTKTH